MYFSKLSKQWAFQFWDPAQRSFPNPVKYCPSSVRLRGNTQYIHSWVIPTAEQCFSCGSWVSSFPKEAIRVSIVLGSGCVPSLPPGCRGAQGVPNQNSSAPQPTRSPPVCVGMGRDSAGTCCASSQGSRRETELPNSAIGEESSSLLLRVGRFKPIGSNNFCRISDFLCCGVHSPCVQHICTRQEQNVLTKGAQNPVTEQEKMQDHPGKTQIFQVSVFHLLMLVAVLSQSWLYTPSECSYLVQNSSTPQISSSAIVSVILGESLWHLIAVNITVSANQPIQSGWQNLGVNCSTDHLFPLLQ